MGNDQQPGTGETASELQKAIKKRIYWFYECQLRRLNLDTFRGVLAETNEILLDLVSETDEYSLSFKGPYSGQLKKVNRLYLDSQRPVWTQEDKDQRDAFHEGFIGRVSNWLDLKKPKRLAAKLAEFKDSLEKSDFCSSSEELGELNTFKRAEQIFDDRRLSIILSRCAITAVKPWLIPEIFHYPHFNKDDDIHLWVQNLERFIRNYENELMQSLGQTPSSIPEFTSEKKDSYLQLMGLYMRTSTQLPDPVGISVSLIQKPEGGKQVFNIQLKTVDVPMKNLYEYPHSDGAKRWGYAFEVRDLYLNQANSDMGLCLLIRALYLYGTLPAEWENHELLTWRKREVAGVVFEKFIAKKITLAGTDAGLVEQIKTAADHLTTLLVLNAQNPCSADIRFSTVAAPIYKKVILGYKFWLDEEFKAKDAEIHNNAISDILIDEKKTEEENKEDTEKKKNAEKEFWSENHYIMFASSEYLAGQLWPQNEFQPAKDFLKEDEKDKGKLSAAARKARGKARVMNWLNKKLMFGWAEYNSSGYYREHLWSLLNLADFALDKDIRQKATVVIDLLFFDVARFTHKGGMGACGGRSQFKSKHSGWDGALGDVVELLFGNRGIFLDGDSQVGFAFASSQYKVPEVLLEIGTHPPTSPFIDRSRVSISFEEAAKYGMLTSKKSDQKDSIFEAYREKREKHYKAVMNVYDEIARTHHRYGQMEEDTLFWWCQSAYYNKENVINTFKCIETFHLDQTGVFKGFLPFLFNWLMPILMRLTSSGVGGFAMNLASNSTPLFGLVGGYFASDILGVELEETSVDELSIFVDGSTRSRTNIYTYRNRDIMLSTVQNFRAGQLNYQTQVNQVSISTELNVFINSCFEGLFISDLVAAGAGGLLGAPLGLSVVGAVAGVIFNEAAVMGENPFGDETDGPSYWTGHYALPMIVQHENAAILACDTHYIQRRLANYGSHAWFPKDGFDQTDERRCSAYENDNFFLEDTFDIGPKGYWLFGKLTHGENVETGEKEEAYIGVFSNLNPEWLDKDDDFYEDKLEEKEIKSLKVDFFANKDWYVDDKNIWILQVGSSADFSTYENFKDRVSSAKISIDDAGDMACTYHVPDGAGNSRKLTLDYEDGGKFKLNGDPYQIDYYPRFQSEFIRRKITAWDQREYVIEYNGQSLLHNFNDWNNPIRQESIPATEDEENNIKGLVIYLKSGDEEMELYSVGKATVTISGITVAMDEVIAAGESEENAYHDSEWIFFDKQMPLSPDMTIEIRHPGIEKTGNDDPEWIMSFSLLALLGDHALWDCNLSYSYFHFEDEKRSTGKYPFSIIQNRWHPWLQVDNRSFDFFLLGAQTGYQTNYYPYNEVIAVDRNEKLWYQRFNANPGDNVGWLQLDDEIKTGPSRHFSVYSHSISTGNFYLFLIKKDELIVRWTDGRTTISSMAKILVEIPSHTILGFPAPNATRVKVNISTSSVLKACNNKEFPFGMDLFISGTDGNIYGVYNWSPYSSEFWRRIDVASSFQMGAIPVFEVWTTILFAMDNKQQLWASGIDLFSYNIISNWKVISPTGLKINRFIIQPMTEYCLLCIISDTGEIWAAISRDMETTVNWERVGSKTNYKVSPEAHIAATTANDGKIDLFTIDMNGKIVHTFFSMESGWDVSGNWTIAEKEGEIFKGLPSAPIVARSRVRGQIEVYTELNGVLWKAWYS